VVPHRYSELLDLLGKLWEDVLLKAMKVSGSLKLLWET
jgi:hypothetical protein